MQIAHGCGSQPDSSGEKQKPGRSPPKSEQHLITKKHHDGRVISHFDITLLFNVQKTLFYIKSPKSVSLTECVRRAAMIFDCAMVHSSVV